jgi:hypothetical protein
MGVGRTSAQLRPAGTISQKENAFPDFVEKGIRHPVLFAGEPGFITRSHADGCKCARYKFGGEWSKSKSLYSKPFQSQSLSDRNFRLCSIMLDNHGLW